MNEEIIRGKWTLDGAKTLEEAAVAAERTADSLRKMAAEGYELTAPVNDDYGLARKKVSPPDRTGVWIGNGTPPELVTIFAMAFGWDGGEDGRPVIDAARNSLMGHDVSAEDSDSLAFKWNLEAEDWMNANVAAEGHQFGWLNTEFRYETDEWWAATPNKGPDQMYL